MKRVAIVDDDVEALSRMSNSAQEAGHEVLSINGGSEDLERGGLKTVTKLILDFAPDVIFIDHKMPYFTGEDLAKSIGFERNKLVGTSSVPEWQEKYCHRYFVSKQYMNLDHCKKGFIAMI